jgi:hypothetical protein
MPLLTTQSAKGFGFSTAIAGPTETNAYWALADTTVSSSTSSIEFTSITTTGYKHLEIRAFWVPTVSSGSDGLRIQFNGDTGTNYLSHYIYGTGDDLSGGNYSGTTKQTHGWVAYTGSPAETYGGTVFVLRIPDYTSTTKKITYWSTEGRVKDNNTGGNHGEINTGIYATTGSAISSIKFFCSNGNIGANSKFALYGIKG